MRLSQLLFPRLGLRDLGVMLKVAVTGTAIAGAYGVLHDQLTYTLSPEYFTHFKFLQFHYADFNLPNRVFVAIIGGLATWWVGFLSGWFLARVAVPIWPDKQAFTKCVRAFRTILVSAVLAAAVGALMGSLHSGDYSHWKSFEEDFGIHDIRSFVLVGYIHNGSYLGGLIGLALSIVAIKRSENPSS